MEVKSQGLLGDPSDERIRNCIKSIAVSHDGEEANSKSIINPNKYDGNIDNYDELKDVLSLILAGAGVDEYTITRADFKLDSSDRKHYKDYAKLNKYLISALAVSYRVQNCYVSTSLFSQEQLSIAVKNKYFEVESYDKYAESNGTANAAARLELRSKALKDNDLAQEFLHKWFTRLDKAQRNLVTVQKRYNNELIQIYEESKNKFPKEFASDREFITKYSNCIFSKRQMEELLKLMGYEDQKANNFVRNYKNRYGIEFFSKKDIETAINEIKRAIT